MKARFFRRMLPLGIAGGILFAVTASAQNDPSSYGYLSPVLSSGAAEIMKLSQAKVSDDTIIAYIKSGGKSFYLNADQILYLRQEGVSEEVITAMLNQPNTAAAPTATSEPATPPPEPSAGNNQTEPYYSTDNAPYYPSSYYYPYYPVYGYYNWSYPFYWPYCWGGYWNGFWGSCWNGHPWFWRNGFCAWNGHACVHHGGTVVSHGNTVGGHGTKTVWTGGTSGWSGNTSFRHGPNNGMWHGNTAFRHSGNVVPAPTSKIVWLDGAGAMGSSPDSMRRNIGVLGGTPNSMQRNIGMLGSGPTTRGNAVASHGNPGAWHGNANVNRHNSAPVMRTAPVMRGNVMSQNGGGFVGIRR